MRLEVTERTLYTFDELSDAAKEKARDWYRQGACDDASWSEGVQECAADAAALFGFDIRQTRKITMNGGHRYEPTIYWRGFWSQGDGACCEGSWYARDVKPGALAADFTQDTELQRIAAEFERIAKEYPSASFTVKHRGHYYHSGCTEFDCDSGLDGEEGNFVQLQQDFPEDELAQAARDFMDWIYSSLEAEHDYLNSAEVVDETIRANEYEFTEDGERA